VSLLGKFLGFRDVCILRVFVASDEEEN
jgi:hypothetical protein